MLWCTSPSSTSPGYSVLNLEEKIFSILSIDHHFAKSNPLHKIFNQNTLQLSYSYTSNLKSIISRHNQAQIGKPLNPPEEIKDNCNCRIKNSCPLEGNCNVRNIVYQAKFVTPQSKETYIGLCDTTFKERYRNHTCSFRNERYKNVTELSKQ